MAFDKIEKEMSAVLHLLFRKSKYKKAEIRFRFRLRRNKRREVTLNTFTSLILTIHPKTMLKARRSKNKLFLP